MKALKEENFKEKLTIPRGEFKAGGAVAVLTT
jgi:hypothetical protein